MINISTLFGQSLNDWRDNSADIESYLQPFKQFISDLTDPDWSSTTNADNYIELMLYCAFIVIIIILAYRAARAWSATRLSGQIGTLLYGLIAAILTAVVWNYDVPTVHAGLGAIIGIIFGVLLGSLKTRRNRHRNGNNITSPHP